MVIKRGKTTTIIWSEVYRWFDAGGSPRLLKIATLFRVGCVCVLLVGKRGVSVCVCV